MSSSNGSSQEFIKAETAANATRESSLQVPIVQRTERQSPSLPPRSSTPPVSRHATNSGRQRNATYDRKDSLGYVQAEYVDHRRVEACAKQLRQIK